MFSQFLSFMEYEETLPCWHDPTAGSYPSAAYMRYILVLSSHLLLCLSICFFLLDVLTDTIFYRLPWTPHARCPSRSPWLDHCNNFCWRDLIWPFVIFCPLLPWFVVTVSLEDLAIGFQAWSHLLYLCI
jgi:hypothetical protein